MNTLANKLYRNMTGEEPPATWDGAALVKCAIAAAFLAAGLYAFYLLAAFLAP